MNESYGARLISEERQRQMEVEGWTLDHDQQHHSCELVRAAIAYAASSIQPDATVVEHLGGYAFRDVWPDTWARQKHTLPRGDDTPSDEIAEETLRGRIKKLRISGALLAAEIDRLTLQLGALRRPELGGVGGEKEE